MTRQTCTLCDQDYLGTQTRRCRCQACAIATNRAHQRTADLRPRSCENPECSNTFDVPKSVHHIKRYCSRDCKQTVMRRRQGINAKAIRKPAPIPESKQCRHCGTSFLGHGNRVYCTSACATEHTRWIPKTEPRACAHCAQTFTPHHGNQRCCSPECLARRGRQRTKDVTRERNAGYWRARRANPTVRNSVDVIGERDGWRCHICNRHVRRADATRDHLIPVADGGTADPTNLRIAHASCNSKRGRGRVPAQLILIA